MIETVTSCSPKSTTVASDSAFAEAEQQLLRKFGNVSLADIAADFALRRQQHLAQTSQE